MHGYHGERRERESYACKFLFYMLLAATAYAERYLTLLCNFSFVFLFVALEKIKLDFRWIFIHF